MSRGDNSTRIAAATPYVSKASLCIDNVSTDVSELAMAKFVAAMDIDVLGCYMYNVKPSRSPYERIHGIVPTDRKAFRLCIPREDTARLMDPKKWPAHVSVSHWIFQKNSTRTEDGHVPVSAAQSGYQDIGHSVQSYNSNSNVVGPTTAESNRAIVLKPSSSPVERSGYAHENSWAQFRRITMPTKKYILPW